MGAAGELLPKSGVAGAISPVFRGHARCNKQMTGHSGLVRASALWPVNCSLSRCQHPLTSFHERKRLSRGSAAAVVQLRSDPAPGQQIASTRDARRGQGIKLPNQFSVLLGSHSRRPLTGHSVESRSRRGGFRASATETSRLVTVTSKLYSCRSRVLLATTRSKAYHRSCLVNRPWVPSVV